MGKDTVTSAKFAILSACLSFASVLLAVLAFGLPYWIHFDDVIVVTSVSGTSNDVRMKFLYGFWRYCNDVSTSIQSYSSCGAVKTHTDLEQLTICLVMLSIILSINAFVNTCLYLCLMKNEKVCLYVTSVSAIVSGLMMAAADINYGLQDHTAKITESYRLPFTVANLSTSFWLSMASCLIISTAAVITVIALYYHRSESFNNDVSFTSSENVKNVHEKDALAEQTSVDGGSIYDKLYVQTNPSDPFNDDYFDNTSDGDEIKQPLVVGMVDTHPWEVENTDMAKESRKTKDGDDMNYNKDDNMKANKEPITDVWSHLEKDNTIYVSSDSESVSASDNDDHPVSRASKASSLLKSVCDNISTKSNCNKFETSKDAHTVNDECKCGTPSVSHLNKPKPVSKMLAMPNLERARSLSYNLEQDSLSREQRNQFLTRPKSAPQTLTKDDKSLCNKMSWKSVNLIPTRSSHDISSNVKDDRSVIESREFLHQGNDDKSIKSGKSRSAWSEKGETHSTGHEPGVPESSHSFFLTTDRTTPNISRSIPVRPCSAVSQTEMDTRQVREQMNYRNQLHNLSPGRSRPITPVIDSSLMLKNYHEETIDPPMEDFIERLEYPEASNNGHQKDTDATATVFKQEKIKTTSQKEHTNTEIQADFEENGIASDVQKSSEDSMPNTKIQTTRKRKKISIQFNVTPSLFPKESSVTTREQPKAASKSPILKMKRSESARPKTPGSNKTHPLGKALRRQLTTFDENHPFARPGTAPKSVESHVEPKEPKLLSKKDLAKKAAYKKLQESYKCRVPRMYNIERQVVYRKLAKLQAESSPVKSTSNSSPKRKNASTRLQRTSPTRHGQTNKMKTNANILVQNSTVTHSEV